MPSDSPEVSKNGDQSFNNAGEMADLGPLGSRVVEGGPEDAGRVMDKDKAEYMAEASVMAEGLTSARRETLAEMKQHKQDVESRLGDRVDGDAQMRRDSAEYRVLKAKDDVEKGEDLIRLRQRVGEERYRQDRQKEERDKDQAA